MLDVADTIVAIASPAGPAPRGIIRLSGPLTFATLPNVVTLAEGQDWQFERATRLSGQVCWAGETGIPVDILCWPDSRSYTRQPAAEIHTLGSTPVLQQIVESLCLAGARLAAPGEFTLRAFLSGRLDLTQAEAVLAIIESENEAQFQVALRQSAGGLAGPLGELRDNLLSVLAELEAGLDFVDEDIEFISSAQVQQELASCRDRLEAVVDQINERDEARPVPAIALIGLPNSGKSSLFNHLTGSDRAIVTEIAGTTTDFISAPIEIQGQEALLIDTAGAEWTTGPVSQLAQMQRQEQQGRATVRVLCLPLDDGNRLPDGDSASGADSDPQASQWLAAAIHDLAPNDLIVLTKSDLAEGRSSPQPIEALLAGRNTVVVSSLTGQGIAELQRALANALQQAATSEPSVVGTTVQRAAASLRDARTALLAAIQAAESAAGDEIIAAEIREALQALGQVVGTVYTDDILDLVFGRFCIGK